MRKNLIGVPHEPLEIDCTPPFLREFAGAMLDSPGPLDKGQRSFYFMTPPPDEWTSGQIESYLAEENDRQIALTTIHEGTPGHYLQLVYSNRCPSVVRAVFGSGVFVEGWAVYVTQVMMDMGFHADDPALLLIHWKFYLRAITNAMIDVGIHAGSMSGGRGHGVDGRGRLPGGVRSPQEMGSRAAHLHAAVHLLRWLDGDVELERERRRRAAAASGDRAVPRPSRSRASSAASAGPRVSAIWRTWSRSSRTASPPFPFSGGSCWRIAAGRGECRSQGRRDEGCVAGALGDGATRRPWRLSDNTGQDWATSNLRSPSRRHAGPTGLPSTLVRRDLRLREPLSLSWRRLRKARKVPGGASLVPAEPAAGRIVEGSEARVGEPRRSSPRCPPPRPHPRVR